MWKDNKNNIFHVPPHSNIYLNITLHDFQNPKAAMELSAKEKFELAQNNKNEGNKSFKEEKYQRAIKKYKKALDLMTDLNEQDSEDLKTQENEIKDLKINCNNNLAMVNIKLNDYQEAINKSNDTLSIDNQNIKAFIRRGHAQYLNGNYEESRDDFKYVLNQLKPNEQETKYATQYYNQAKQKIKDYQDKQKQIYARMFK